MKRHDPGGMCHDVGHGRTELLSKLCIFWFSYYLLKRNIFNSARIITKLIVGHERKKKLKVKLYYSIRVDGWIYLV